MDQYMGTGAADPYAMARRVQSVTYAAMEGIETVNSDRREEA
jgi:hypothetical protein